MTHPRGKPISMHCFEDAYHASDKVTKLLQTGLLVFCNRAPVLWLNKKQNSVETSFFGSEFTALNLAVELVIALRYKLHMFGLTIYGTAYILCDNKAVFDNTSTLESVLRKKRHSIAYHKCREAVAAFIWRISKEDTETNLADLFTKIVGHTIREWLLNMFTY